MIRHETVVESSVCFALPDALLSMESLDPPGVSVVIPSPVEKNKQYCSSAGGISWSPLCLGNLL